MFIAITLLIFLKTIANPTPAVYRQDATRLTKISERHGPYLGPYSLMTENTEIE